ncbi:AraC family transcriptional regulator [Celeribacter halophilus]|uniref:Transcriptional regulator, AraC family n=1 Tax=Celeribacter halophilus TaxID=576117 RepID=A0A1I3WIK9_9RHOB|nr:AraC family transcriptional regulator [Celeribacter halophilus]PZX06090.1 AraC family transcriptional regulator [Celeribacter halophilus]SFK07325.1 transcriptional regulator, AraC family [Celeribacter halophilus]
MHTHLKTKTLVREVQYDNFVDQERGLDGWKQLYRQLSPGAFEGHIAILEWHQISLCRETMNQKMENFYRVPDGAICVGFSLGQRLSMAGQDNAIGAGTGMIHVADEEYHIFTDSHADFIMLTLAENALSEEIARGSNPIPPQAGHGIADWMLTLIESARQGLAQQPVLDLAPDLLIDRISLWARDATRQRQRKSPRGLMSDILVACDTLPFEKLSVNHLSKLLDRNRADLRACCLERTEMTLDDMLKGRRLSEVHRRLRLSDPRDTKVSDISMEFGYYHWGRFSQTYRAMFGERPSDTLRRDAPKHH